MAVKRVCLHASVGCAKYAAAAAAAAAAATTVAAERLQPLSSSLFLSVEGSLQLWAQEFPHLA